MDKISTLARIQGLLVLAVALGCSVASFSGTLAVFALQGTVA